MAVDTEIRKQGVGGSDCSSVFNVGYGCKRRLWYDKRDVQPDYERETSLMDLGTYLEPFFANKYVKETGREAVTIGRRQHPAHPEIAVNIDRQLHAEGKPGPGVLEIKSVGRAVFYKIKREGMPEDYILQLQHGMLVTGASWGAFCVGCRDNGEIIYWDVERSQAVCDEILLEVPKFWATVQNGPMPEALDADDRRCQKCEYRRSCQGNNLIEISDSEIEPAEDLRGILHEVIERQALLQQAEELVEESKEQLKTALGSRQAVSVGKHKVYYRPQAGSTRWDGKAMAKYYPKLIEALGDAGKMYPGLETFKDIGKPFRALRIF